MMIMTTTVFTVVSVYMMKHYKSWCMSLTDTKTSIIVGHFMDPTNKNLLNGDTFLTVSLKISLRDHYSVVALVMFKGSF